jgi:hypothetical protein
MFDVFLNHKPKFATKRKMHNYNKGDFVALCESLKLLPLTDIVHSENDIDIAWSKWKDLSLLLLIHIFRAGKLHEPTVHTLLFYKINYPHTPSERIFMETGKKV